MQLEREIVGTERLAWLEGEGVDEVEVYIQAGVFQGAMCP